MNIIFVGEIKKFENFIHNNIEILNLSCEFK